MTDRPLVAVPVEWAAVAFPGPALSLAIAPALAELVGSGAVRLIDADLLHTSDDEGAPSRTWTASCASC